MLENTERGGGAFKNEQSRETAKIDEEKQHNNCWTPLYVNKHK